MLCVFRYLPYTLLLHRIGYCKDRHGGDGRDGLRQSLHSDMKLIRRERWEKTCQTPLQAMCLKIKVFSGWIGARVKDRHR